MRPEGAVYLLLIELILGVLNLEHMNAVAREGDLLHHLRFAPVAHTQCAAVSGIGVLSAHTGRWALCEPLGEYWPILRIG